MLFFSQTKQETWCTMKKTSLEIREDDEDQMKEKTLWIFQRLRRERDWPKGVCDDDL